MESYQKVVDLPRQHKATETRQLKQELTDLKKGYKEVSRERGRESSNNHGVV